MQDLSYDLIAPPKVVAEIGCNHMGDVEIAKDMIRIAAKTCHVDAVKFQKRDNKFLLTEAQYNAPHPVPENSYGPTYGAHREFLEFDADTHIDLIDFCKTMDITYSTSVWDLPSAQLICDLSPDFIKIPSACNLNGDMLKYIAENFTGKIHISFGMTTRQEEADIIQFLKDKKRLQDTVLYACTSTYPAQVDDLFLFEVKRLKESYGAEAEIGFSGHHTDVISDIAALALGASWFERHFTLDHNWKGTDHAASLEPAGLEQLVMNLHHVHKGLLIKPAEGLPGIEDVQRKKLKTLNSLNDA